jgi:hypothetical protein
MTLSDTVQTTGAARITLTANSGAISRTGGSLTTQNLLLIAANGISHGSCNADNIQANNTTSGNIILTNIKTVTVTDITASGYGVQNVGGGTITLATTAGSMYLYADVLSLTGFNSLRDDGVQTTEITTTGVITLRATNGSIGQGSWAGSWNSTNGYIDVNPGFSSLDAQALKGVFVSQVGSAALSTSQISNFSATGTALVSYVPSVGLANLGGTLTINSGLFTNDDDRITLTSSGDLNINNVVTTTADHWQYVVSATSTGGNVNLSANIGSILSGGGTGVGHVTITANGSILDDGSISTRIISAGIIDLTATTGSIGTVGTPVNIINAGATVNTSAPGGIYTSLVP